MARYDLRASIIRLSYVGTTLNNARTLALADINAALPDWTVEGIVGREAAPVLGEWVSATKSSGEIEYGKIVVSDVDPEALQILFGDGSRRGLAAAIARAE